MMVVYTCPKCGSDLEDLILATYPPRSMKRCTNPKCGWSYTEGDDVVVRIPYQIPNDFGIPDCCRNCSNHPRNGGSGICCCTLPYMTTSGDVITYGTRNEVYSCGEVRSDNTSL